MEPAKMKKKGVITYKFEKAPKNKGARDRFYSDENLVEDQSKFSRTRQKTAIVRHESIGSSSKKHINFFD